MSIKKIQGDNILVEVEKEEAKTASGIHIPSKKEPGDMFIGKVVFVGLGLMNDKGERIPMESKVGDRIMFQYGTPVVLDGKRYIFVSESSEIRIFLD